MELQVIKELHSAAGQPTGSVLSEGPQKWSGTCLSLDNMQLLGNMDIGLFFHYWQSSFSQLLFLKGLNDF